MNSKLSQQSIVETIDCWDSFENNWNMKAQEICLHFPQIGSLNNKSFIEKFA